MKARLEFNLPEERVEFDMCTKSGDMHSVLWDMDQWLRSKTKYAPDDTSEDTFNAFELCRETLHELLNENNINLDIC
jgi:hypothetical protein